MISSFLLLLHFPQYSPKTLLHISTVLILALVPLSLPVWLLLSILKNQQSFIILQVRMSKIT